MRPTSPGPLALALPYNGLARLPARPGLYLVLNLQSGRRYVGSTGNVRTRCRAHYNGLRRGDHDNYKMRFDANAHGYASFVFFDLPGRNEHEAIATWGASRPDLGYNLEDAGGYTLETRYRLAESRLVTKHRLVRLPGVELGTPISPEYVASWMRGR